MNNTFQIDKVYSNTAFYANKVQYPLNLARFNVSLYIENLERCPWPKTRAYSQRMIDETKEVFTYFVVIRRTKSFIYLLEDGKLELRKKIRKDDEGNEFVIIDNIALHASDLLNLRPGEAKINVENIKAQFATMNVFLRKLEEIEEYGYTYLNVPRDWNEAGLRYEPAKIVSEEELRKIMCFEAWQ